ncbi:MAG: 4Fe-4S dicluster domain-containing protein, partial [Planctomycetota bacterium]
MSAVLEDAYAKTLDCVHCGLCLPACPTYELLSSEVDSPRGRIHLMRAVAERRLDPGLPELLPPIQRCLGCRACESACPSGVRYGSMLEGMRELLLQQGGFKARVLGRLLDWGLARRGSHRRLVGLLYLL